MIFRMLLTEQMISASIYAAKDLVREQEEYTRLLTRLRIKQVM